MEPLRPSRDAKRHELSDNKTFFFRIAAAFPALFALAWVCAHDARKTAIAAVLLAFAQLAFWRIVLDHAFVNSRI